MGEVHDSTSQRRIAHIDPSVFTSMADRCAIGLLVAASSFSEKAYLRTAVILIFILVFVFVFVLIPLI
jgi:hypothetical protein